MAILSFRNLTLSFGDRPVLDRASLSLEARERVCLIGRNGEGKTSLLRLLNGEVVEDSGETERLPDLKVAKLDQAVPTELDASVYEVVAEGLGARGDRLREYHRLLDHPTAEQGARIAELENEISLHDDWNLEHSVERVISQLGLAPEARFNELSGGLKRRVLLGRAIIDPPHLLLLDEPTNHLDLESIEWLERFLLGLSCCIVFVTHDRAFVRRLATSILDIDRGRLTRWDCDYATYLNRKADALAAEEKEWAVFDKKLAEEEVWIRQGIQARRTRNEGRVRALKRLRRERSERRDRTGTARMQIQEGGLGGRKVIHAEALTYRWEDDGPHLLDDFSTTIWRGDKIGIIGPNGSGKTTLLNLLLGKLKPQTGSVRLGTGIEMALLDQLRGQLDEALSVAENVCPHGDTVTIGGQSRHILSYLRDFLFSPQTARAPVRKLSGGERARVLLAKLFARPANLIVLDEPTNDLDLETIELLEELLAQFDGTVLLVSHDREFLENVVTAVYALPGDGSVIETADIEQAIREEARRASLATGAEEDVSGSTKAAPPPAPSDKAAAKPKKLSNKEREALITLPRRIEELETALAEATARLGDPATYAGADSDGIARELNATINQLQSEIDEAYAAWETLESRAEALKS